MVKFWEAFDALDLVQASKIVVSLSVAWERVACSQIPVRSRQIYGVREEYLVVDIYLLSSRLVRIHWSQFALNDGLSSSSRSL